MVIRKPPNRKIPPASKGSKAGLRTCALRLLGYRSRSRKEMLEKLRARGFDDEQINGEIEYLENAGLLNDEDLASELFRYSIEIKSLGKKGVRMFLYRRGIEKGLIDKTVAVHTEHMEEKTAQELVERKLRSLKDDPEDVVRRRLWGMLQRRGFSTDVMKKAVGSIFETE